MDGNGHEGPWNDGDQLERSFPAAWFTGHAVSNGEPDVSEASRQRSIFRIRERRIVLLQSQGDGAGPSPKWPTAAWNRTKVNSTASVAADRDHRFREFIGTIIAIA